ncbi:hypothetical protein DY000_02060211 [Brassica cretica]|uniref:Uncharacterized protein n=1 Tax=Brassica cretica TaxID=69181 RepID=A0ABQ7B3I3_BRACR|nr:hypothetical protein DY000_02060211 [Brassica cretica]
MEAFNGFAVTMEDRMCVLHSESEVDKRKAEVRRVTEELRTAKEEPRKKTGEAMILRDEWKRARQERTVFEIVVAALRTKVVELEADRDRDVRRGSCDAHCEIANGFREVLTSLEKRWVEKNKEVSAEIQLHEVVANLDLLNEIKDEGLVVDDEIVASSAAVPDWSVEGLDLPQVFEDSIVGDEDAISSTREEASS